jgi:hypothetical protein
VTTPCLPLVIQPFLIINLDLTLQLILLSYTMRCLFRTTLLLLASARAVSADAASNAMDAHVQDMVAWLRDQGGYFNEKLRIRRADPSDPTSYFGIFATESIPSMEPLMSVPASSMIRSILLKDNPKAEHGVVLCDLTNVLLMELKLGEKSHFAPYVKYLLGQERGQIPATWTEPAKELLREVFSASGGDKVQVTDWIEMYFEHEDWCIEAGNAFEQQALAMVVQRGWDSVLIPIYDMLNHVNDVEKLNTDNNSVYSTTGLRVWASKTIEAGEELFLTYDNCSDCQGNPADWGTAEILRDFGFVELYPRRFNFWVGEEQILFAIDEGTNEKDGEDSHHLEIEWLGYDNRPSYEGIADMKEEYQRLQDLQHEGGALAERRDLMPEKEWNTIFQYQQALTVALQAAIKAGIDDLEEGVDDEDDDIDEDDASSKAMDAHVQDMVAWLRDQGGYFNEKLQIRRADPSDPTSYFGVFAIESIPSMELLMSVPASLMIRSIQQEYHSEMENNAILCELTHVLMKELKLGEESHFAPYVKYLLGQERGQIPATWTEPAKALLREVLSASAHKTHVTDWIEMTFEHEDCIEAGNAFEQQALAMVVQRGWDSVLIPIYDMLNHMSDPEELNTDNNSVYSAEGLRVWASKTIEEGEELFLTYDNCFDCGTTPDDWGTTELLRDFGFVEQYPQQYKFWGGEEQILFAIDEGEDDEEIFFYIDWRGNGKSPSYEQIEWMEEEYQRLVDLQHSGVLAERRDLMSEKEWNTIFQYHQALTVALEAFIQAAIYDLNAIADEDDSGCGEYGNGSCAASWIRYKDLNKEIESSDAYYKYVQPFHEWARRSNV